MVKTLNYRMLVLILAAALFLGCAHQSGEYTMGANPGDVASKNNSEEKNPFDDDYMTGGQNDNPFDDDYMTSEQSGAPVQLVADPIAPWNKMMFHLNDKLYFYLLKPVATIYKAMVHREIRMCIGNFFDNLSTPVRLVNCVLQGKTERFGVETGRFLINSTIGIGGLLDIAKKHPDFKKPEEEDLGQTLAVYGMGNGFYIVWPVLGPSTLRDTLGTAGDMFLSPTTYIEDSQDSMTVNVIETVNGTSLRIGDYESLKQMAIKPYEALRNAYIQNRKKKIAE